MVKKQSTDREDKVFFPPFAVDVSVNMFVVIQPPMSHSDLMSFSSGCTHSNLACVMHIVHVLLNVSVVAVKPCKES